MMSRGVFAADLEQSPVPGAMEGNSLPYEALKDSKRRTGSGMPRKEAVHERHHSCRG